MAFYYKYPLCFAIFASEYVLEITPYKCLEIYFAKARRQKYDEIQDTCNISEFRPIRYLLQREK